ncbi:MAG TPA: copper chaperone PCu(A)C, partial [Rudaea sp.]
SSEAFGSVSLHKTVEEGGVAKMRPLDRLEIAAGSAVTFAPGGRHFMLMRPTRELKAGDVVTIRIATEGGSGAQADFAVRETAP